MPIQHWDVEDKTKLRNSLFGLDNFVSKLMFGRVYHPAEFGRDAGATLTSSNTVAYISFPDSASNGIRTNFIIPEYWVSGNVYIDLYYSGNVATGNYRVEITCVQVGAGDSFTTRPQTSVVKDLSPPSVANEVVSVSYSPYLINAGRKFSSMRITRYGAHANDTNTGNFYLFIVPFRFYPDKI